MAGKCHKKNLEFVNEFSFCCHSTIKKILWNSFYLMVANSEKKPTIFDLTFDTHDNPGDIFKIYKWVWNFLFLISLCEQVLKTHQKHNIFWCVFVVFCIRKPPDFLNEGAIRGWIWSGACSGDLLLKDLDLLKCLQGSKIKHT